MREVVNKTVVRMIVGLDLHHDSISSNTEGQARITLGIGVATREGFDGGAATIPSPAITEEYPIHGWLFRWQGTLQYSNSATFGLELDGKERIDRDLRGSRKIDKGVLYFAAVNNPLQNNLEVEMTGLVRALILTG